MAVAELFGGATGALVSYVPAGADQDELLDLVRMGVYFKANHIGKRPGALSRLILDCTRRAGPPYTFARLLDELSLEAARRELHGERASPVEKVDRIWELVTIHLPKQGRVQVPFATVRNHLTTAKKIIRKEFPPSPNP